MQKQIKQLWTEKYRPKSLDEYIFQNSEQRSFIEKIVKTKDLPHLLLTGQPGSGKTSISKLIVKLLEVDDSDVLIVNGSDTNGIDYIRDVVINFASTYSVGDFKVVRFEEFDFCTPNAQGILRDVMEEYASNCRFILTCNYEHKVMPAIKSRTQQLIFKSPSKDDVFVRACEILVNEDIEFEIDQLETFVNASYPDIRKIINNLQMSSNNGLLTVTEQTVSSDYKFKLLDMLKSNSFKELRKLIIEQVYVEEYDELYRFLYQNIHLIPAVKSDIALESGILVILNDAQYKHKIVAVPELNLETCLSKIQEILQ